MPDNTRFILRQIELCIELARSCNDREIGERLLMLAKAFAERAIETGAASCKLPDIPDWSSIVSERSGLKA